MIKISNHKKLLITTIVLVAFFLGCSKSDTQSDTQANTQFKKETIKDELQTFIQPINLEKENINKMVEIRIRTTPNNVDIYSDKAVLLGNSGEKSTFTTYAPEGRKITYHLKKIGYQNDVLELTPRGLLELHYRTLLE